MRNPHAAPHIEDGGEIGAEEWENNYEYQARQLLMSEEINTGRDIAFVEVDWDTDEVTAALSLTEGRDDGYITLDFDAAVATAARGRGLGTAMVKALIDYAKALAKKRGKDVVIRADVVSTAMEHILRKLNFTRGDSMFEKTVTL